MKNELARRVMSNKVVGKVVGEAGKFYLNHQSVILTSGTIGFSMATTAVAMKNATKIHDILYNAHDALAQCNTKEEKNAVYKLFLKELTPLVLPILIFQAATIGCALASKKQLDIKDKKIAEVAGALSISQAAVAQYQAFAKEAETALGEKKYDKLQSDIYKDKIVDGRKFTAIASEGAPGEVLMIDKYSGRPFWSTTANVQTAADRMSMALDSGRDDVMTISNYYDFIGNTDLTSQDSLLANKFGFAAGSYGYDSITAKFTDTHYRFPNGTVVPAFEVYLWPEPACIEFD